MTASALVAPLAVSVPAASVAAAHPPVRSFGDYERADWLRAPDISVNPPGVAPGEVVAPPVRRGYLITGDQLHRFEITGTPQATAELRALVKRAGLDADSAPLDTTGYRVFTTPPIIDVQYVEVLKEVTTLLAVVQAAIAQSTDPAFIQGVKDTIEQKSPTIGYEDPESLVPTALGLVAFVTNPAFLQGLKDEIYKHAPTIGVDPLLPIGTAEALIALATSAVDSVVDLITNLNPDPSVLVPYALALLAPYTAPLSDGSLPININDDPESILGDITHLAPVGTDAGGLDDALSDQGLAEVFVLPVGVGVGEIGAAWDDGRLKVTTVLNETPAAAASDVLRQQPGIPPEWDKQPLHCLERKSNGTAYYDPCYQYATLAKDGDPSRVAWTHHQKGTGKSKGIWRLVKLTVQSDRRIHTPDQQWQDWSPEADISQNCDNYRLQIGVNGVGLSKDYNMCDEWLIDKDNPSVNWKVRWDGNAWRKSRNVAGMKTFSVPNNFRPDNVTKYDYEAW